MTQLEQKLAEALGKQTGIDILGIIDAALRSVGAAARSGGVEVTVNTTPVTKVETGVAEPAKRVRKAAESASPNLGTPEKPLEGKDKIVESADVVVTPCYPPLAELTLGKPATNSTATPGIDITGLFEGSGASKKLVKAVFMTAVEKASSLASLVALNAACDCGFATGDYTEETAPVLKRKLTRWGAAQE